MKIPIQGPRSILIPKSEKFDLNDRKFLKSRKKKKNVDFPAKIVKLGFMTPINTIKSINFGLK